MNSKDRNLSCRMRGEVRTPCSTLNNSFKRLSEREDMKEMQRNKCR